MKNAQAMIFKQTNKDRQNMADIKAMTQARTQAATETAKAAVQAIQVARLKQVPDHKVRQWAQDPS